MNSKSDPVVFGADAGEGIELNSDDELILMSDFGKPKNDLDAAASAPTPGTSMDWTAESEAVLSFPVVSLFLSEGDLSAVVDTPCAMQGGDNFDFLCLAVLVSGDCELVRAIDFSKEKHLCGSIMRDDLCLETAECVCMRLSPGRTYVPCQCLLVWMSMNDFLFDALFCLYSSPKSANLKSSR